MRQGTGARWRQSLAKGERRLQSLGNPNAWVESPHHATAHAQETPASQGRARPSPPCPSPASEAKIWERQCALSSPPASEPGPEGAERACGRGCGRFPLGRPRAPLAPPGALGGPGGARGRREERRRGEARTGTPPGSSGYLWESWLMGHTGTVLVRLLACHGVLGERSELCRRKHWMTRSCL